MVAPIPDPFPDPFDDPMSEPIPDFDPNTPHPGPATDIFKPPEVNTVVSCLHCGEEYDSYKIHWVEDASWGVGGGFWACGTPGCDGKGFCFDIWPTDPEWRDENGMKVWIEDDDEGLELEEDQFDDDLGEIGGLDDFKL